MALTGHSLGKGLCHGEMGCADCIGVGDSEAKQSRATLQTLFAYEGTDHTADLRSQLDLAIKSYNNLVDQDCFDRVSFRDPSVVELIPSRAITSADMQVSRLLY